MRAEVLAALLCGVVEIEPGQPAEVYIARARAVVAVDLARVAAVINRIAADVDELRPGGPGT